LNRSTDSDAPFIARIRDALQLCGRRNSPQFVGFLDERQAMLAQREARRDGNPGVLFYGGHEDAERTMLGVFPSTREASVSEFPISLLTARYRPADVLTHRDFLGGLMSCGIERSTVGDLLIEDGRTVLFVTRSMTPYLLDQLKKVGRVGIKLREGAEEPYPAGRGFETLERTVSSMRLDAVVAALLLTSREKSASLIQAGLVQLRFEITENLSAEVRPEDKLSVRGYGRFMVEKIGSITRKGRYKFLARKYI